VKRILVLALLALAGRAAAEVEIVPKVGADFEHFGETYRITADRDTVNVIDDYGTRAGLLVRTPGRPATRFALDVEGYAGRSTRRARATFDGALRRAADSFQLRAETAYRAFTDGGDYTVSGDHLEQDVRAAWEHRLSSAWSLRFRDAFDGTWYEEPDEYNLTSWTHEPRVELGLDLGESGSRARAGYRYAVRDVPDSATLGYRRHGADAELTWYLGDTTSLDVAETAERRQYDAASVRESSWENRVDARFEFGLGDRATCRILHENEIVRFDDPDELDFDSAWARSGVQLEVHRTDDLDLSVMPIYAFLTSAMSPVEEYAEAGVELGVDWRMGRRAWLSLTNEVGRRDYEVDAVEATTDVALGLDAAAPPAFDTAYSDYLYDRLTLVFGAEPHPGVSANLFLHWQPESHDLSRDDTATQIVSGGVTYAF
jgi:hypothetical protein